MNNPSDRAAHSSLPGLIPSLILVGVGIFATLPAFWTGSVFTDDSLKHLVMSRHFIDQLAAGELYPRWLGGLNDGLGSPVMFFYGPVPDYMTALFRPLAGSDPEGWHQLCLAAALAVLASGFSAYAWLQRLGNDSAALIGAISYMATPYHLTVALYQRFAFAELWGFVWMPLVLWLVHAVLERRRGAGFGLAVSYALLIMTHLPTTLLFSLIPPLYALCLAKTECRVRVSATVVGAMLLGLGMSSVYLVPALLLQPYVQLKAMESGQFYFGNNFLFYGPRFIPELDALLKYQGVVNGGSFMVLMGAYGLGKRLLPLSGERVARFWVLVGATAFFMVLQLSKPVWELLPMVQKVQFPWRFGTVLTLSMAALLTLWLGAAGQLLSRTNVALLVIVGLVGLMEFVPIVVKEYLTYPDWSREPSLDWLEDQMAPKGAFVKGMVGAAKVGSYTDFLPNGVDPGLLGDPVKSFITLRTLASAPEVDVVKPASGMSLLQINHMTSRHLVLAVQSETPVTLQVRQFYFPGWVATVRGETTELKVRPSRPSGLIEVDVPAGRHDIDLVLKAGPAERSGRIISLISVIVFWAGWARLRYLARGGSRFFPVRRTHRCRLKRLTDLHT